MLFFSDDKVGCCLEHYWDGCKKYGSEKHGRTWIFIPLLRIGWEILKNISLLDEIDFSHLSKGNMSDSPFYIPGLLSGPDEVKDILKLCMFFLNVSVSRLIFLLFVLSQSGAFNFLYMTKYNLSRVVPCSLLLQNEEVVYSLFTKLIYGNFNFVKKF